VTQRRPKIVPDDLPLFPSEEQIAVLGAARAKDWPRIAEALEDIDQFPQIDPIIGARYWPAVEGYFNNRWNVDALNSDARLRVVPRPLRGR
jgi:hypothetical protein